MRKIITTLVLLGSLILTVICNTAYAGNEENRWTLDRFDEQYSDLMYKYYIKYVDKCEYYDEAREEGEDEKDVPGVTAYFLYLTAEPTYAIMLVDDEGAFVGADEGDAALKYSVDGKESQIEMYYSSYKNALSPTDRSGEAFTNTALYSALQNDEAVEAELCFSNVRYVFTIDGKGFSDVYAEYEEAKIIRLSDAEEKSPEVINALKAWSVGKASGLTDAQCAAVLGNMYTESNISPYRMECDYTFGCSHDYSWCDLKEVWDGNINWYTKNRVFPVYNKMELSLNYSIYGASRFGYACGVGLCGFTGDNYDALVDYAAAAGTTWHDEELAMEIQLAFIFAGAENSGYSAGDWLKDWGNEPVDDAAEAAELFNVIFERNTGNFGGETRSYYTKFWYSVFAGTVGDPDYGQYVIEMAQSIDAVE